MMKKIAKKWGSSLAILFTREERKIYGIEEGAVLEIEIIRVGRKDESKKGDSA